MKEKKLVFAIVLVCLFLFTACTRKTPDKVSEAPMQEKTLPVPSLVAHMKDSVARGKYFDSNKILDQKGSLILDYEKGIATMELIASEYCTYDPKEKVFSEKITMEAQSFSDSATFEKGNYILLTPANAFDEEITGSDKYNPLVVLWMIKIFDNLEEAQAEALFGFVLQL